MNAPDRLSILRPNADWAKLPLFGRQGWKRYRFDELAENIRDTAEPNPEDSATYVGLEHMDPGSLHVRRWGSAADLIGQKLRMRKGDILFARRNAYLRRVAIAPHDGLFSAHGMVLRARTQVVLHQFLPYLMLSDRFMARAETISVGSLSPTINWTALKLEEFDLPPLDQQARIADAFRSIDGARVATERASSAISDYRQALLDSLGRSYAKAHALVELEAVIEEGRPVCYGILKPGLGVPEGIPVIKVRDYPSGHVQTEDLLLTTPEIEAPFKRSRLRAGDLLLSIRGTVGRLAEIPPSLEGANITQDTARLSIAAKHNREYIRAVLESRFLQDQIVSRITGLAVKGINIGEVRKLQIPLPPLGEQDRIAAQMREISSAIAQTDKHADGFRQILAQVSSRVFPSET